MIEVKINTFCQGHACAAHTVLGAVTVSVSLRREGIPAQQLMFNLPYVIQMQKVRAPVPLMRQSLISWDENRLRYRRDGTPSH